MNIIEKFQSRISERAKSWIAFTTLVAVFFLMGIVW